MVIFGLFYWWYTTGWLTLMQRGVGRVQAVGHFFSIPLLLGSLFAPFRQISAGQVQGSLAVQMRAWGDRLFSRFMGAIIRSMLVIVGAACVIVASVALLCVITIWPFIPLLPLIAAAFVAGVGG